MNKGRCGTMKGLLREKKIERKRYFETAHDLTLFLLDG